MGAITILGIFVADTAYRAARQPRIGETVLGQSFALGPGGKGSNQSVAAARAGGAVTFISRLGEDPFAEIALRTWAGAGVIPAVTRDPADYTGAAYIFIEASTGNNAIIVAPGAAASICEADVEANRATIETADIFITQLEQPLPAARHGLQIARAAGVTTILNPAPAAPLDAAMLALCDYVTPNESEAEGLTGIGVVSVDDARAAGDALLAKGVGCAIVTLGGKGSLVHAPGLSEHVPAFSAGPVAETTGAGDAFNGTFAVALSEGRSPLEAARFAAVAAGISVTRPGTAPSMPSRPEIDAALAALN